MIFRADRCFAVLPLLFLQPVLIHSQISGVDPLNSNRAGINSVTGLIFTPDRVPISRGIMVRLSKGTNDFTAWTDQDGKFIISGVGNGTYTLSVEAGDDFEPTSERLEVAQVRGAPAQTYYVNIQLRWKPDARKKPGVIDSELASAPRKAQEYYR